MNKNDVIADYYSRHRSQLVQMLTVRTSDADVAQDMVQDVFLRLLNGFPLITPQTLPNLVLSVTASGFFLWFCCWAITSLQN